MITKRERLAELHDQLSRSCGINKMIQPFMFLTSVLAILMDTNSPCFTTKFIDESFVSYHLIRHILLNKTHTVTSDNNEIIFTFPCWVTWTQHPVIQDWYICNMIKKSFFTGYARKASFTNSPQSPLTASFWKSGVVIFYSCKRSTCKTKFPIEKLNLT